MNQQRPSAGQIEQCMVKTGEFNCEHNSRKPVVTNVIKCVTESKRVSCTKLQCWHVITFKQSSVLKQTLNEILWACLVWMTSAVLLELVRHLNGSDWELWLNAAGRNFFFFLCYMMCTVTFYFTKFCQMIFHSIPRIHATTVETFQRPTLCLSNPKQ